MKSRLALVFCSTILLFILSGCLYPNSQRTERQANPQEFIVVVQSAVDSFKELTGILPIKNSEMDTPLYQKYIIDFQKLKERGLIGEIPPNAFENGGSNYYVLVDVETEPKVKLLDMVLIQQTMEVQQLVDDYRMKNSGQVPAGMQITSNWYSIDFEKVGKERVQIKSLYSEQYLSLLVHVSGKVVIDYAPEIMKVINNNQITDLSPETDLRTLLVDNYYYVPVQSHAYHWINDQPVVSEKVF